MHPEEKCWNLSSLCLTCKHINLEPKDNGEYTCKAFPSGIPAEICFGDFDHRNPHPSDDGIHYERTPRLDENEYPTMKDFDEAFERIRREREDFDNDE